MICFGRTFILTSTRVVKVSFQLFKMTSNGCNGVQERFSRLPTFAKPKHYEIVLKPNLETFKFCGQEKIDLEVSQPTDFLKFYSHEIEITEAVLSGEGKEFKSLPVEYNERWQTATLKLPEKLTTGNFALSLKFVGTLNDKMHGFYRSKYVDREGKESHMATTQFESTYARLAFPCWDEPVYKTTFDISLTVPEGKTALSNMPEIEDKPTPNEPGWKTVKFDRTPLMSTYLCAFIVGDFDYLETTAETGTLVRVYTTPGKKELGHFALECASKALPFYTKYFNVPYPLPKCDLIAIPDFSMGAMENWGLVTYREVYLLLDPKESSSIGKENIALVVGHELAHMWFGNLTTMEWWTDLWLKEGYATFMEYVFTHANYPEFDIWVQFIKTETLGSMSLDALQSSHPIEEWWTDLWLKEGFATFMAYVAVDADFPELTVWVDFANRRIFNGLSTDSYQSSHPIEVPINDPEEVDEIYDNISYAKSSSIIRMLHAYLGDQIFRKGLHAYLEKYQYKNTVTENLWSVLTEASGQNVAELMRNWTQKMGYPVVKVSGRSEGSKRILTLEQKRFFSDGSEEPEQTIWQVPITIATSKSPNEIAQRFVLKEKKAELIVENVGENEWIKLNSGFTGYYRVHYSPEMLEILIPAVKNQILSAVDRFNIIGDVFALVRNGTVQATQFLDILDSCRNEMDYTVWSDIDGSVGVLMNCLERKPDLLPRFNAYIRQLYKNVANRLGWDPKEGESHTQGLLRPMILYRLGMTEDSTVIDEARKRFDEHLKGSEKSFVPDLRSKIYSIVAMFGGDEAQKELQKIYETSDFSEKKRHCLFAVGQTKKTELLPGVVEFAMSDKVRLQDLHMVFFGMSCNQAGQELAWNYFRDNFDTLIKKHGSASNNLFTHLLKVCCRYHCSEEKAKEIEEFFGSACHSAALDRPVKQSVENIRLNAALLERNTAGISDWLTAKGF